MMPKVVRGLNQTEQQYFSPYFDKNTLESAQIVEGYVPFWLRRRMCAVVLGKRIYLRKGVYQQNTPSGITLLAHELTHVEQYLKGMTIIKYLWASRHGYRNNRYEVEAYKKAALVCSQVLNGLSVKHASV